MSIFQRFQRTWDDGQPGFGSESYSAARAAGYSNADIQSGVAGYRVGKRATDMIGAGLSAETSAGSAARRAQADADNYRSQLDGYKSRVLDFESQIGNYQTQVSNLSNQYNKQLQATSAAEERADDFEDRFEKKSAEYTVARDEADRYRNEAVGNQLRSLRAGSSGSGQRSNLGGGASLAAGGPRFSGNPGGAEGELLRLARERGLADTLLKRKGPVVERMSTGAQSSAPRGPATSGLSRGAGTGSYYASRFG